MFTRDNFESFNFPHEKKGSFKVEIENCLADTWQDCLEKKCGTMGIPPPIIDNPALMRYY